MIYCHCPVSSVLRSTQNTVPNGVHTQCRHMVKRTELWKHIVEMHSELVSQFGTIGSDLVITPIDWPHGICLDIFRTKFHGDFIVFFIKSDDIWRVCIGSASVSIRYLYIELDCQLTQIPVLRFISPFRFHVDTFVVEDNVKLIKVK